MTNRTNPFSYWKNVDELPVRNPYPLVSEVVFNVDEETGSETVVQTLHPGYKGTGSYGHDFIEEAYALSGRAYCHTAKKWVKAGDYICRTPGMIHGPFTVPEDGEPFVAFLVNTRTYVGQPIVAKDIAQWKYEKEGHKGEEGPKE